MIVCLYVVAVFGFAFSRPAGRYVRIGSVPGSLSFLLAAKKRSEKNSQTASLCWHYLSSRAVASQVLSAQVSLTTVFGMGTGGPSPQSTPTISISTDPSVKIPSYYSTLVTSCQETFGDPYRIRTDVKGVRGLCLNHLTNGPFRCSYPLSAHQ